MQAPRRELDRGGSSELCRIRFSYEKRCVVGRYVVWLDVAWRVVVRSIAAEFFVVPCDVAGRDNLPWCHGTLPGEASSEESFSVPWDVGARRYRRSVFRCIARRRWANVDGLDVIGGVAYVVPRDVAMRDLIDGAASLCCGMWPGATSLAETFVAPWEVARCDVNGRVFSSCRSSPVLDVIDGISFVVWLDVARRVVISGTFRRVTGRRRCCIIRGVSCCATGCRGSTSYAESFRRYRKASPGERRRARRHRQSSSLTSCCGTSVRDVINGASSLCCGTSPGATSSAESIVVLQDVAWLRVSY